MHDLATRLFLRFRDRGDEQALSELFDRVAPGLLRAAQRLTSEPGAGEDLVQATFVVAIAKAAKFRCDATVRAWLFGILAHEALRQRRRSEGRIDHERVLRDVERSEPELPLSQASARETQELVMAAVERLPDPYRRVLLMHLVEELGGKEIAARTTNSERVLTADHARVLIQRGLTRLRQLLGDGASFLIPTSLAIALGSRQSVAGPLASVKGRVMGTPAVSSASASTPFLLTGVLMNKFILLSVGAVLLAAAVLLQVNKAEPLGSEHQIIAIPEVPASVLGQGDAPVDTGPAPPPRDVLRANAVGPGATRDVNASVAAPGELDPAHGGPVRAVETLVSMLGLSLGSSPPALHDVDALVSALAEESVILEDSLRYADDGRLKTGKIELPGTAVRGDISVDGSWTRVTFSTTSQGGEIFFAGHFSVVMKRDETAPAFTSAGGVSGGSAIFQHHPNTSESPPPSMEPLNCGWSFSVSGERTSISKTIASRSEDGRGWEIGRLRDEPTVLEGASHLTPFDAWAGKLSPILSH